MTDNLHATAGPVERPELPPLPRYGVAHLRHPDKNAFWKSELFEEENSALVEAESLLACGYTVRRFTIHEAAAPEPGVQKVTEAREACEGIPGFCFDIDGERWHKLGGCPNCWPATPAPEPGSAGWAVPNRQAEDDRSQFDKAAEKLREAFDEKDRPVLSDPVVRPANDVAQEPSGAKGAVPVSPEDSEDAVVRLVSSRILRLQLEIEEADAVDSGISRIESAQKEVAELRSWLNRQPAPAPERRFTEEEEWAIRFALAAFREHRGRYTPEIAETLRRMLDEATERP